MGTGERFAAARIRSGLTVTVLVFGEQVKVLMSIGYAKGSFVLDTSTLDGTDILDGDTNEDVSEWVQSVIINRGRSDQFESFRAGTMTMTLLNNDRRFDPINEDSPYWDSGTERSKVTPRRRVQVIADNISLFTGRITDIDIEYDQQLSTVTIYAADDFVKLANAAIGPALTPPEELSGERVTRILDLPEIDFPAAQRSIDTGVATVGSYTIDSNTNAADYLARVAAAEQGLFFCKGDGTLRFRNRTSTQFGTADVQFVDRSTDPVLLGMPYQGVSVIYGSEFLYNRVQVQTVTGTVQTAEDTASQDEYGVITLTLTDSLLASDSDALHLAESLLSIYKTPDYRFNDLSCLVSALDAYDRYSVMNLDMGDLISISRKFNTGSPSVVTDSYAVDHITHQITPDRHTVTFGLYDALLVQPLILDDSVFGTLDDLNALG